MCGLTSRPYILGLIAQSTTSVQAHEAVLNCSLLFSSADHRGPWAARLSPPAIIELCS
jgi:hypothetical protein